MAVPEVGLQASGIHPVVGELEAACQYATSPRSLDHLIGPRQQ
jgi:hypothetical protein